MTPLKASREAPRLTAWGFASIRLPLVPAATAWRRGRLVAGASVVASRSAARVCRSERHGDTENDARKHARVELAPAELEHSAHLPSLPTPESPPARSSAKDAGTLRPRLVVFNASLVEFAPPMSVFMLFFGFLGLGYRRSARRCRVSSSSGYIAPTWQSE
jgi:hypothetical protein